MPAGPSPTFVQRELLALLHKSLRQQQNAAYAEQQRDLNPVIFIHFCDPQGRGC
jgi:hypothetical protein